MNSLTLKSVVEIIDGMIPQQDVDWAMRKVAINRRLIAGPPVFLPLQTEACFLESLARKTGERHLGAIIGQHYDYEELSWYSTYVLSARTLGEAMLRAAKALPVLNPGCRVALERRDQNVVVLFYSGIPTVVGARHIDEGLPCMMIDLCRRFLGRNWMPAWIETPSASHGFESSLAQVYDVPLLYRPYGSGIGLDRQLLDAPNPNSTGAEKKVLLRDLPGLLGVSPPSSFAESVNAVLRVQLMLGDTSIETVAHCMSLGTQSLQRRLRAEGTSFRDVRNAFLKARAVDLLRETNHSITEIAGALGYTETNSFRRAFRTWTGRTPTDFSPT
ncbi:MULTISPECIES: AraC family transcriptional regulator [Aliiruegeria]|uniref:AraC family transcriptional regulator n=1 Tax=Aliiruegeria TaxID=2854181 RepID=UPI0013D4A8A2|nr:MULTISPECIES: AraC family transcriptional regulator [Aliiruegeria]